MNLSKLSIEYVSADHFYPKNGSEDFFRFLPRPYASIAYLYEGSWEFCEYRHNEPDSTGNASAGDLLYVPCGSTYNGKWKNSGKGHIISIHFETASLGCFSSRRTGVQAIKGDKLNKPELSEDFNRIALLLASSDKLSTGHQIEVLSKLYRILGAVLPSLEPRSSQSDDVSILPALDHLREHYREPCTVAYLAELCKLSPSHFYSRFKLSTGVAPIEYKNRLMIANAERLLLDEPELSIEVVSERMGFSSGNYFSRMFKRMSGLTPSEFRKNGGGSI